MGDGGLIHHGRSVLDRPLESRQHIEALAHTLFVVGGDALGGRSLDISNHQGFGDFRRTGHWRGAGVAAFDFGLVRAAAGGADVNVFEAKRIAVVAGPAGRQHCLDHPIGAAFVVDQAARAEFGNGQKARALQIGPALAV